MEFEKKLSQMTDVELVQKFIDLKKNPGITTSRIKFSSDLNEELRKRKIELPDDEELSFSQHHKRPYSDPKQI